MPSPPLSRAVKGRAVAAPEPTLALLERSSFLGRCLAVARTGDPGSFLTKILGGAPAFLDLYMIRLVLLIRQLRKRTKI
jgi:hypothetical protein